MSKKEIERGIIMFNGMGMTVIVIDDKRNLDVIYSQLLDGIENKTIIKEQLENLPESTARGFWLREEGEGGEKIDVLCISKKNYHAVKVLLDMKKLQKRLGELITEVDNNTPAIEQFFKGDVDMFDKLSDGVKKDFLVLQREVSNMIPNLLSKLAAGDTGKNAILELADLNEEIGKAEEGKVCTYFLATVITAGKDGCHTAKLNQLVSEFKDSCTDTSQVTDWKKANAKVPALIRDMLKQVPDVYHEVTEAPITRIEMTTENLESITELFGE